MLVQAPTVAGNEARDGTDAMITLDLDTLRAALARGPREGMRGEDEAGGVAAVAAVLREGDLGPELLLIERAQREGDPWSGHMAMPGGRRDPGDESLLDTAIRETREEIGLDLGSEADLVGRLEDVDIVPRAAASRGWIRPFVFLLRGRDVTLTIAEAEVKAVVWAPLRSIHAGELDTTFEWSRDGAAMSFPGWNVEGRVVWGLTYRMMRSMFELL